MPRHDLTEHLPEVAVWHYGKQTFVSHIPCEGEKRVRIDVHDSLDNYDVFPVETRNGMVFTKSDKPLTDWRIDLS